MLTKEERAAKFAIRNKDIGLRSRGFRKLTTAEQLKLYDDLSNQDPEDKLQHLRILREALQSSNEAQKNSDFEVKVYESSITESILQGQLEVVPHLLSHITQISQDTLWHSLLAISLSNTRQFHEAFLWCHKTQDWQYATCIANKDIPLWECLVSQEKNELAHQLMLQNKKELDLIKKNLQTALEHPKIAAKRGGGGGQLRDRVIA